MLELGKVEELLGIHLQDAGDNWKACCPFHQEKTPSFFIHKEDLVCHCFGCGVAGGLAGVVAKKQRIPIADVRALLNISVLEVETLINKPKADKLKTYSASWLAPWKRISNHPYTESRGFLNETIEHFEARWDQATRRVVFPIWNGDTLCGASGRSTDGREPKWFFYWNCQKSRILWAKPDHPVDNLIITDPLERKLNVAAF